MCKRQCGLLHMLPPAHSQKLFHLQVHCLQLETVNISITCFKLFMNQCSQSCVLGYFCHSPIMSFCTFWSQLKNMSISRQKKKQEWEKEEKFKFKTWYDAESRGLTYVVVVVFNNLELKYAFSAVVSGGVHVRTAYLSRGQRECK